MSTKYVHHINWPAPPKLAGIFYDESNRCSSCTSCRMKVRFARCMRCIRSISVWARNILGSHRQQLLLEPAHPVRQCWFWKCRPSRGRLQATVSESIVCSLRALNITANVRLVCKNCSNWHCAALSRVAHRRRHSPQYHPIPCHHHRVLTTAVNSNDIISLHFFILTCEFPVLSDP